MSAAPRVASVASVPGVASVAGERPVALVGLRAAGKSRVGRELAPCLGRRFVDLDERTLAWARQLGRPAHSAGELLEREGVAAFRQWEAHALRQLLEGGARVVLATGGGTVERADNRAWLRRASFNIWLAPPVAVLRERMAQDPTHRPGLLGGDPLEELEALGRRRAAWYREVADLTLEAVEPAREIARDLARRLFDVSDSDRARTLRT